MLLLPPVLSGQLRIGNSEPVAGGKAVMKSFVAESGVEEVCLDYFADLGWQSAEWPRDRAGRTEKKRAVVVSRRATRRDACALRSRG